MYMQMVVEIVTRLFTLRILILANAIQSEFICLGEIFR